MAGRIKGITIEIGGDTTKLQTALRGVNGAIKNTQSQLKDVNRLLKLDPGNATLLAQKHKLLGKEVENTKTKLDTLKKASEEASKTAKNWDAYQRAMEPIQKEIDETEKKLGELKQAKAKADEEFKAGKISKEDYDKIQTECKETEDKLKDLKKQAKDTADEFGNPISPEQYDALQREIIETEQDLKNLEKQAAQSDAALQKIGAKGTQLKKVGEQIASVGKSMSTYVTAPLAAAGAVAVSKFAEVDKTMQLTNKTMGNTAEQAGILDKAMKDAAANSTFGMNDAANASLNFARAGLTAEQAAAALAPSMNLAAGEGGNLDTVSAGLVATINGFHGSFDDAGKYADVFASACNNSALDVDSLSHAMSVAAPVFSAAGYKVNDAALYMGVMANNGIDADKAANSLKTGLAKLVSPAKEGAEMMDALGISVTNTDGSMKDSVTIQKELNGAFKNLSESEQIAAASAIFGKNQMAPWLALINTAPGDVKKLDKSLKDCAGTTDEMSEAMMSGFGGSIEQLKSSLDVLMTSLGQLLARYLTPVIKMIQGWVNAFNKMSPPMQNVVVVIGMIVAAVGPLLLITGKMLSAVGTIMTFAPKLAGLGSTIGKTIGLIKGAVSGLFGLIAAHPVVAIIAGVVALVAALVRLYQTNETFRNIVNAVWSAVKKTIMTVVTAIAGFLQGAWNAITSAASTAWTGIRDFFSGIWKAIQKIFTTVVDAVGGFLKGAWEGMKTVISTVWNLIMTFFTTWWNLLRALFTTVVNAIGTFLSGAWNGMKNVISTVWNGIRTLFTTTWNAIKTIFTTTVNAISTVLTTAWSLIKTTISTVWNGISAFFTTIWTTIQTVFTTALSGIQTGITTVFNTAKAFISTTWNAISSTVSGIVNGIKTTVVNVFGQLVSGIQTKLSAVTGIVKNGFQGAINFITGLPAKALQWGKDFIGGIIKGINGMIGSVKNAAKSVADAVSSVLHFSRPDEGPLRDYETWMPDFMEGLARGIHGSSGRVKAAIRQVVMEIRDEIRPLLKGSILPGAEIFGSMGHVADRLRSTMDSLAYQMQNMGQQLTQRMQALMQNLMAKVQQFLPTLQSGGGSGLFGISEEAVAKCREMVRSLIVEAKSMGQQFMQDMLAGIRSMADMARKTVTDAMDQIRRSMQSIGGAGNPLRGVMGSYAEFSRGRMPEYGGQAGGGDLSAAGIRKLTDALTSVLQSAGSKNGSVRDIVIPVYLGSTILDEVVVSAQQRANLRSGGR